MFVLTEQRKEIEEDQKLESLDVKLGMRQSGTGLLMVVVVVAVVLMRELTKPGWSCPAYLKKVESLFKQSLYLAARTGKILYSQK